MAEQAATPQPETNLHVLPRRRTSADVISDIMDAYDLDTIHQMVVIVKPADVSGVAIWSNGQESPTIVWLLNHAINVVLQGDLS